MAKHITGCISEILSFIAAYRGQTIFLIVFTIITCLLCWAQVPFVRTTIHGILNRIITFMGAYLASDLLHDFFVLIKFG